MFCPKWNEAFVIRLGDLLDKNGKIIEFKVFTVQFSINCNILFYYKVITAIPKERLIEIEQFVQQDKTSVGPDLHCYNIECHDFAMDIHKASTKAIYMFHLNSNAKHQLPLENGRILYRQLQICTNFSNFYIVVQGKNSYKLYNIA